MYESAHRSKTTIGLAAAAALLAPATAAFAIDYVWSGALGPAWSNPANWLPPGVPGVNDTVTFPQSAFTLVDLVDDQAVDIMTFSPIFGAYQLVSEVEVLTVRKIDALDTDDPVVHVIESDVAPAGGGAKWTIEGTTTLRHEGSLIGSFSLGKLGDGIFELTGDSNAYLGELTIGEGPLVIRGGNALSDSQEVRLIAGATMTVEDDETAGALNGDGDVFLGASALVIAGGLDRTFGGVITGDADSRLGHAGTGRLGLTGAGNAIGAFDVDGGEVVVGGGDVTVAGTTAFGSSSGTLTIDGGSVVTGAMNVNGHAPTIRISDTAGVPALTIGTNDGDSTVGAVAVSDADGGAGSVRKVGNGTLTMTGASTYSGGTAVAAGTLLVMNAAGSATGTGGVDVAAGAVLGGTGTAAGTTTVNDGATVTPGTSAGTLTLGDVSFEAGSTLAVEISGRDAGAFDQLVVNGLATIDGGELELSYIDGFSAGPGHAYVVLEAAALSGEFATVTFPDDLAWSVQYDTDNGTVTAQVCPDLNGNGSVDFGDILVILASWGQAGGPADLDGSGFVDFGDLLVILSTWGPCP